MGLMNIGGWSYYGGPSGLASGADAFTKNFMQMYLSQKANQREQSQVDSINKLRDMQMAEMERKQKQEDSFRKAVQSGYTEPVSETDALFALAKDPSSIDITQQVPGRNVATLTDSGEQQLTGLMSGGFDANKAMAAALPHTDPAQLPQMIQAMKTVELMPLEQKMKILDMLKTRSEIEQANDTWTEETGHIGGKEVLFRRNKRTNKLELVGQDRSTNVNVSTPVTIGGAGYKELSGEMGKKLVEERKDVEGAVRAYDNIKEAEKLMDSGMITGTGAEYLVNFGNFLSSRLGVDLAKDPVANTQAYAATMGNQVGQIIKQFGSGTGLSDADREYAEKIVGGKITLNEQALRKLHDINKRAHRNLIENFNKKAEQVMSKPEASGLPYDLRIKYNFDDNTRKPRQNQTAISYKVGQTVVKNGATYKYLGDDKWQKQ